MCNTLLLCIVTYGAGVHESVILLCHHAFLDYYHILLLIPSYWDFLVIYFKCLIWWISSRPCLHSYTDLITLRQILQGRRGQAHSKMERCESSESTLIFSPHGLHLPAWNQDSRLIPCEQLAFQGSQGRLLKVHLPYYSFLEVGLSTGYTVYFTCVPRKNTKFTLCLELILVLIIWTEG